MKGFIRDFAALKSDKDKANFLLNHGFAKKFPKKRGREREPTPSRKDQGFKKGDVYRSEYIFHRVMR